MQKHWVLLNSCVQFVAAAAKSNVLKQGKTEQVGFSLIQVIQLQLTAVFF